MEYVGKADIFNRNTSFYHVRPKLHNFFSLSFRDKHFPAFGFGARLPPNWQISHEFPLVFISFLLFISSVILVLGTLSFYDEDENEYGI